MGGLTPYEPLPGCVPPPKRGCHGPGQGTEYSLRESLSGAGTTPEGLDLLARLLALLVRLLVILARLLAMLLAIARLSKPFTDLSDFLGITS